MSKESKLNMAAMKKTAKNLDLDLDSNLVKSAEIIQLYMNDNYEKDALALCGNCGYESYEELNACPYCGIGLGDYKIEEDPNPKPKPKLKAKAKKETKTKKAKKVKSKKIKDKTKNKDKDKSKVVKKKGKKVTELAKIDPKDIEVCDNHIKKIKQYKNKLAKSAYDIGVVLKEIHDKNLWKSKNYKSFSSFCKTELEYTREMAYRYMTMVNFDREDAISIGPSKATIIVNAPKSKKDKLFKMAKDNASRLEMKNYLNDGKSSVPSPDNKITILGRVKKGENVVLPWISDDQGKYVEFEVVDNVNLTITEDKVNSDSLIISFSKIE